MDNLARLQDELNNAVIDGTIRDKLLGRAKGVRDNLLYSKIDAKDIEAVKEILHIAGANGLLKDLLLDNKNTDGDTALNNAFNSKDKEIVKVIFEKLFTIGESIDSSGVTTNDLSILKAALLVKNYYDISPLNKFVLADASIFEEVVKLAASKGALEELLIPEAGKSTALHLAVDEGQGEIVEKILNKSAEAEFGAEFQKAVLLAKDSEGATPLHIAIDTKAVEEVKALVGIDNIALLKEMFSYTTNIGETVLHSAKAAGEEVMQVVYEKAVSERELLSTLTIEDKNQESGLGKLVLAGIKLFRAIMQKAEDAGTLGELLGLRVLVTIEENGVDKTEQFNLLEIAKYEEKDDILNLIQEKMGIPSTDSSTDGHTYNVL